MTNEFNLSPVCKHGMLDGDLLCSQCKEDRMQPSPEIRLGAQEIQDLINHGFATVNGVPLSTLTWEETCKIWNAECDKADAWDAAHKQTDDE